MTYRVVHFGTGYAGMHALRGIINHPELELVGLVVHSDNKAGKDAGELAGVDRTGVIATQDLDAAIALDADAFCYMATTHGRLKVAIGELCRILESGKNVATTSFGLLIHPARRGPTFSPGSRKPRSGAASRCCPLGSSPGSSATTCR